MLYSPEQAKKNAYILSILLFIAAFTALFTASLTPTRAIMQLIAVGCITGGIFILSRYALQTFVYRLDDADSENNDLTVHRIQGKRSTAVCRMVADEQRQPAKQYSPAARAGRTQVQAA